MTSPRSAESLAPILEGRSVDVVAPGGRPLFCDLNLDLGRERVAIVGRNGAGKTTLLKVLSGTSEPASGRVTRRGRALIVNQELEADAVVSRISGVDGDVLARELMASGSDVELSDLDHLSRGELRKLALAIAKIRAPDLLLLDEPSQDLDAAGLVWLRAWLAEREEATVMVSHDRELLGLVSNFFVCSETGCHHFSGSLAALEEDLEARSLSEQKLYLQNLNRLVESERRSATVASRRRRKKNLGRLHEIRRAPSRAKLNENRSYAQASQGKRAVLRKKRLAAIREWTRASRRRLTVSLPLDVALPKLPDTDGSPSIDLQSVTVASKRILFRDLTLRIARQRVAVVGPNGAGKTTLLKTALGEVSPDSGKANARYRRIGSIAQGALDWCRDESLIELLVPAPNPMQLSAAADALVAHRFPFALADRPLASLSPGERVRAALIVLFQRPIELLVVDEPTCNLDFLGARSLQQILRAWPGGLLVASHDRAFLGELEIDEFVVLDDHGGHEHVSDQRVA